MSIEQLVLAYRAIAGTHEMNTTSMLARDHAEGAKWGGEIRYAAMSSPKCRAGIGTHGCARDGR
jgi:hypothetical protein